MIMGRPFKPKQAKRYSVSSTFATGCSSFLVVVCRSSFIIDHRSKSLSDSIIDIKQIVQSIIDFLLANKLSDFGHLKEQKQFRAYPK